MAPCCGYSTSVALMNVPVHALLRVRRRSGRMLDKIMRVNPPREASGTGGKENLTACIKISATWNKYWKII
jgi:hypothetical protein